MAGADFEGGWGNEPVTGKACDLLGEGELDDGGVDRVDMWAVETDGDGFAGRDKDGHAI